MNKISTYKRPFWQTIEYSDMAFMLAGIIAIDISVNFSWQHFAQIFLGVGIFVAFVAITESGVLKSTKFKRWVKRTDVKLILALVAIATVMLFYTTEAYAFWFASEEAAAEAYIDTVTGGYTGSSITGAGVNGALKTVVRLLFLGVRISVLGTFAFKVIQGLTQGDEGEAKRKTILTGLIVLIMSIMIDMAGNLIIA